MGIIFWGGFVMGFLFGIIIMSAIITGKWGE